MTKALLYIILGIFSLACICAGGKPATTTPTPAGDTSYLFIFTGESNSGGTGSNASATAGELAPRPAVQILNNTTFVFQDLDIGTNNLIDHNGFACCATHGWELELANIITSNPSYFGDTVFLVKAGQGGSIASNWAYNLAFMPKYIQRLDSANSKLAGRNIKKVIFLSQGINDILGGTSRDSFRVQMLRNISNFRAEAGGGTDIPVILTKFTGVNTAFNGVLDTIAYYSGVPNIHAVPTDGASFGDPYHWNYSGLKVVAGRLIDTLRALNY